MPSAGPNGPSTVVSEAFSGSSSDSWNNLPAAATSDDSNWTFCNCGPFYGSSVTPYLKATGFGFSLPANAQVDGIQVEWKRWRYSASSAVDSRVRIVKGGTVGSTDRSSGVGWPDPEAYQSYGGASDLWGETWSRADVNATDFGAAIAGDNTGGGNQPLAINYVRITVYYTLSNGTAGVAWMRA